MLSGSWNATARNRICSVYNLVDGRGRGVCNVYEGDSMVAQTSLAVSLRVSSDCVVKGTLNAAHFTGRLDERRPMILEGLAFSYLGNVMMVRTDY